MKIFTAPQIREADAYTIVHEPIASIDLMKRASAAFVESFCELVTKPKKVYVFCGQGNNGGDGLVISRYLIKKGYSVKVFVLNISDNFSPDCKANLDALTKANPNLVFNINTENDFPTLHEDTIVIDAIFGTGLSRPVEGLAASAIHYLNHSDSQIFAVDIPSGMYCDKANGAIIKAKYTFTFQLPKLSFLMCSNTSYVGEWKVLDIGLDENFIGTTKTPYQTIDAEYIKTFFKHRQKCSHKGTFGHSLIIAGAYGKMGAAVLSANACLRAGTGLLTVYIPKCGYTIMQTALPEAMAITDNEENSITDIPGLEHYQAIGIGPGIGTEEHTARAFKKLLLSAHKPLVIDADALNLLSKEPSLLNQLPKNSVLTPHIGEFSRLTGPSNNDWERMEKARNFAAQHNCVLVLKGAYTSVNLPGGDTFFNITGNQDMATGGSGDVLTGIITGLLAQGYEPAEAAILGVYIHGRAGDLAVGKHTQGLIARDIIENLPRALGEIANV